MFESNQSGIETRRSPGCTWINHGFESNQSGIETTWRRIGSTACGGLNRTRVELKLIMRAVRVLPLPVWIEPEWNWNFNGADSLTKQVVFESNQSGIETGCNVNGQNVLARLNRTRVELKHCYHYSADGKTTTFESNQSGIETLSLLHQHRALEAFESNQSGIETRYSKRRATRTFHVWIEPEWNWNTACGEQYQTSSNCLNRTRVELKHSHFLAKTIAPESLNRTRVELKRLSLTRRNLTTCKFESNQSGIETVFSLPKRFYQLEFESNQSGIETCS